jgi:hypothetical protein
MANIKIKGVGTVKAPDGFSDLSKEEQQKVVNRLARQAMEERAEKTRAPESSGLLAGVRTAGQGLALGFGDEIEAGLRTGFGFLGDYDETVGDIRQDIDLFRKENPVTSAALEIGGGLLTGGVGGARAAGALAARKGVQELGKQLGKSAIGRAAGKTGTTGVAAGVGTLEGAIAGAGAAEGGLSDRLGGAAVGGLAGGVLGAAAPTLVNTAGRGLNRAAYAVGLKSDDAVTTAAERKALQKLEDAQTSPEAVQQSLDEVRASGVTNAMIPDVAGESTRSLARASAAVSGEGRDIATKALDERAANLGDEIANDVGGVLAGGKTARQATEEIIERQSRNASNDYNAAFYVDGDPAGAEVTVPVSKLKGLLGGSKMKSAYERAVEDAELEGVPMPKYDDIISGKATGDISLRQLHYMKMGLDGAIETGARQGSLASNTKRLLVGRKNEFLKLLDDAAPQIDGESSYKIARNKFAGDAALRDAIEEGKKFMSGDPDELAGIVGKMSESEKEAFRIGVAQAVRNSVDSAADLADAGKRIFGSEKKRKALRAAFPDDATFNAFEKRMKARAEQVATRARTGANQGSRTAVVDQEVADLGQAANIGAQLLGGNPMAAAGLAERVFTRTRMPELVGSRLAGDLFSTDPATQRAFLERLAARRAADQARMARNKRMAARYGAGVGVYGGLLAGDE